MSEVTKPIALDESFNTTGQTPKNIADVIKNGLQEVAQAIDSHQGGGGHVILDQNGNALDQEPNMQFVDAHTSDDSTNEKTVIENIKSATEADFRTATEDGLYDVDVEGAEIGEISEDYVEVTADGVKTYGTLLSELFALTDTSKITKDTKLKIGSYVLHIDDIDAGATTYRFERINALTTSYAVLEYLGFRNSPFYRTVTLQTNGTTFSDTLINGVPSNGTKITLYYGNDKAVVDLQTTANRCWYDSNNTVKQKIDTKADTSNIVSGSVSLVYQSAYYCSKDVTIPSGARLVANFLNGIGAYNKTSGIMITNLTATSARITAYSSGGNYTSGDTVGANYIAVKS